MPYAEDLIEEFCQPYCTDARLLGIMESTFKKAFQYAEQELGDEYEPESIANAFRQLLKIVQCANRDVMEEAEQLPYQHNWQTPYPDLWSPYLDFTEESLGLADTDRKIYYDDLSNATLQLFPWLKEPYKFTPMEIAVVVYDIWLQTIMSWENPYVLIRALSEETLW